MEPSLDDDKWIEEQLAKRKKKNRLVSWVLIVCLFMWAFFINGQMLFWEFSGQLGLIPIEEAEYLVENIEYYYYYKDVFKDENYLLSKRKLLKGNWVSTRELENLVNEIVIQAEDDYSYFYYDSFIDFRRDYTYIQQNVDDEFKYRITEENLAVISFKEFIEDTSKRFIDTLKILENKNIKELVIDLRGNSGGLLYECNIIADSLLPETEIISQLFNDGSEYTYYSDSEQYKFDRIIVFVDENSASCSEMLALTLKVNLGDKVQIIGKNTIGKDVTQNVVDSDTFNYSLFIVSSKWDVLDKNVKDLNEILDAYDNIKLDSFEDYYEIALKRD